MTELKDDLSDIKTYYKMAQGALQEKDIIEALKISEMGLRKAKSLHDNVWVSKFTELTTQIHYLDGDYNQFTANAIAKNRSALEELSHIEGVGVSVAEKLIDSGFDSIHAIASSTPAQLAQIRGIGPMTAQKIIENAISHSHIKSLNNFGNSSSDASSVDNNDQQNFEKKLFDEKFSRSKPNVWYSPSGSEVKEINNESYPSESTNRSYENELIEEPFDEEEDFEYGDKEEISSPKNMSNFEIETHSNAEIDSSVKNEGQNHINSEEYSHKPKIPLYNAHNEEESEELTLSQLREIVNTLLFELKARRFGILPRHGKFSSIYKNIDIIAIKPIKANELLDILLIVPIKVNQFQGSLAVYRKEIKYIHHTKSTDFSSSKVIEFYIAQLKEVQENIFVNITSKNQLFEYFKNYLKADFSLVASHSSKNLSLMSGPVQLRLVTEPILINKNDVGFLEKILPFAYLSDSNIHVITSSMFTRLLEYIEKKYILIERYGEKEDTLTAYLESHKTFMERERLLSIPILSFGFIALLVILSQGLFLLDLILTLGYVLLGLYAITSLFLYLSFYKKKSALKISSRVPYYKHEHSFDDSSLVLISNELSPKLMTQFSYECLGKILDSNVITEIEQQQAQDRIIQRRIEQTKEVNKLFEPAHSTMTNRLIKRYSSFLEE